MNKKILFMIIALVGIMFAGISMLFSVVWPETIIGKSVFTYLGLAVAFGSLGIML